MSRQPPPRRSGEPNRPQRLLPQNIAAEQSVLGGILLRPVLLAKVATQLTPEVFFDLRNRAVYKAMLTLRERGEPIDTVTIETALTQAGILEQVGVAYLATVAMKVPTPAHVEHYAALVRDAHGIRRLMLSLSALLERGYEHPDDLAEYQARALSAVSEAITRTTAGGPRPIAQGIKAFAREMDRRYQCEDGMTGVPTGHAAIDREFGGLQAPDLIILAGRPAMGKTALAHDLAINAAERGVPVVVFSLEMTEVQLIERFVCARARITSTALRRGEVTNKQLTALNDTLALLGTLPMQIDDSRALSAHQLSARAQRFALEHPDANLGLVVVDYLQLMRSSQPTGTREQEIAAIMGSLKGLAKVLGWPVVALSQLNRSLESRANKRPVLADLRESGSIEQDADIVWMLYREAVYDDQADKEYAELLVAKNRHGGPETIELRFEGQHTRFEDWNPKADFKPRLVD